MKKKSIVFIILFILVFFGFSTFSYAKSESVPSLTKFSKKECIRSKGNRVKITYDWKASEKLKKGDVIVFYAKCENNKKYIDYSYTLDSQKQKGTIVGIYTLKSGKHTIYYKAKIKRKINGKYKSGDCTNVKSFVKN